MNRSSLVVWFALLIAASMYYYGSRYVYAPDTGLEDLSFFIEQKEYQLDHLRDSTLVVHFYAAWCGPCMKELPILNKNVNRLNREGISIVGLTDDKPNKIKQVTTAYNLNFPVYELRSNLRSVGVPSIPTTFVLNKEGDVVFSKSGVIDWESFSLENIGSY